MRKVLIQFDGSNFYNKVKKILPKSHLTYFDYLGLAQQLAGTKKCSVNYYVGEIKRSADNKKSHLLYKNQQALFFHLRKQNIAVKLGFLLRANGVYHEKGVDVQIAVDMAVGAVKNKFDVCYLFSSDTDLLPAIETAKQAGKQIIYVAFKGSVSRALKANCSSFRILSVRDLTNFFASKKISKFAN